MENIMQIKVIPFISDAKKKKQSQLCKHQPCMKQLKKKCLCVCVFGLQ